MAHINGVPGLDAKITYSVSFQAPKMIADDISSSVHEAIVAAGQDQTGIHWVSKDGSNQQEKILLIMGIDREAVLNLKTTLEGIFVGDTAVRKIEGEIRVDMWHDFFATKHGDAWLKGLSKQSGVLVVADQWQCSLRIYRPVLLNSKVVKSTSEVIHLIERKISDVQREVSKLNLPCSFHGENLSDDHVVFSCGHAYCTECLVAQIDGTCRNTTFANFPVRCVHMACGEPIDLSVICEHLPGTKREKLL
ncbi:hypothetical protein BU23DRAFT_283597 [Bimuria novae-zelandiae CBS 107.79]|uniref:RING-type domain-containing protein n=1 Tax=Bimuria novae-zelandiae CBS 107.79 TaxID=1447943 RepID=A0A6A5UTN8_9PLEO|nr:hypothetical protein BU23DRAFT_283597 [Bimuria novae-zelandiae CBS 107.79]